MTHSLASRTGAKKRYGRHRGGVAAQTAATAAGGQPLRMSESHKVRYQHAKLTAMAKLMSQVGKPYRWGGKSPTTGFDCSGLIYYAYKDLIRVPLPRTANEMYHLRDAAPVKKANWKAAIWCSSVFATVARRIMWASIWAMAASFSRLGPGATSVLTI